MSKEKYREQDYRLIGQATFDNTHSPCPDITHSVAYGQEFQIVERLDGSLEKLQSKNAWAMALIVGSNGQPLPNSRPKKVPLKFLAVKGSVETYTWYFGKYNRVQGKVYSRMCVSGINRIQQIQEKKQASLFAFLKPEKTGHSERYSLRISFFKFS